MEEININQLHYRIVFNKDPELVAEDEMVVRSPNRTQLGLNLSTGFVFEPMGYQKIMLLFRYELGHTFLSGDTDGVFYGVTYQEPMRVRNQGFRISLTYLVDLKTSERKKGKSTNKESQRKKRR